MSDFRNKIIKTFTYSLVDLGITKVFAFLSELVIINSLSKDEIGIWGIGLSYLVFTSYFAFTPENILLRDFSEVKNDKNRVTSLVSSYLNFNFVKAGLILLISFSLGIYLYTTNSQELGFIFIALAIQKVLLSAIDMFRLLFYVDFKQDLVAKVNAVQSFVFLICIGIVLFSPSIFTYGYILIATHLVFALVWWLLYRRVTSFRYEYHRGWIGDIKSNFKEFTFWNHLGGAITQTAYTIDPWVLSFFVGLTAIGNYTIALKISNYFFILPMVMQKSSLLHFSNKTGDYEPTLRRYILIYGGVAIAQLVFFIVLGKQLTYWFFEKTQTDLVYSITLLILLGITVLNVSRPFIALLAAKFPLRDAFFQVYLPFGVLSVFVYFVLATMNGVAGVAIGNLVNYSLMAFLLVTFYLRKRGGLLKSPNSTLPPFAGE